MTCNSPSSIIVNSICEYKLLGIKRKSIVAKQDSTERYAQQPCKTTQPSEYNSWQEKSDQMASMPGKRGDNGESFATQSTIQ